MLYLFGVAPSITNEEADYSKYLGSFYEKDFEPCPSGRPCSTYIMNHSSTFDAVIALCATKSECCFVTAGFYADVPCLGFMSKVRQAIFVERQGSASHRNSTIEAISERQREIEMVGTSPPILMAAEGNCSNNRYLLPFKRGAFNSLKSIIPIKIH